MSQVETGGIDVCPMANYCTITSGELAPPCGTVPDHMSPLTVATDGCIRAFCGAKDVIEQGAARLSTLRDLAWSAHDLGMIAKTEEDAEAHFAESEALVQQTLQTTNLPYEHIFPAAMLQAYRPVFRELRTGRIPIPQQRRAVAGGLCDMYDQAQAAPVHTGLGREHYEEEGHQPCVSKQEQHTGFAVKLAVPLLALRRNIDLWPASPREQSPKYPTSERDSGLGIDRGQRHDMYQLLDPTTKVPIRAVFRNGHNSSKRSGPTVLPIYYTALVNWSLDDVIGSTRGTEKRMALVYKEHGSKGAALATLDWLVSEVRGERLPAVQRSILDAMSARLENKLRAHAQTLDYATDS